MFKTNAASALAAWQVRSDGTLKFRTTPYVDLEANYQSGYGQKGDRIWIDFPGELTQPRKLVGNGPIKEISDLLLFNFLLVSVFVSYPMICTFRFFIL